MSVVLDSVLVRTPGTCGGRIRIVGTRITVHRIATLYKQGQDCRGHRPDVSASFARAGLYGDGVLPRQPRPGRGTRRARGIPSQPCSSCGLGTPIAELSGPPGVGSHLIQRAQPVGPAQRLIRQHVLNGIERRQNRGCFARRLTSTNGLGDLDGDRVSRDSTSGWDIRVHWLDPSSPLFSLPASGLSPIRTASILRSMRNSFPANA